MKDGIRCFMRVGSRGLVKALCRPVLGVLAHLTSNNIMMRQPSCNAAAQHERATTLL
jgi:hypothetical protein